MAKFVIQITIAEEEGDTAVAMSGAEIQEIATPEGNRVLAPLELFERIGQAQHLLLRHQRMQVQKEAPASKIQMARMGRA